MLTGVLTYELTPDYTISARQSFDFGGDQSVLTDYSLIRHFDRWYAAISVRVDYIGDSNGIFFNVWPEGLAPGSTSSGRLAQVFQ